jgi:crotonobetainyl-CoA:carnitine CoA-transferase CaiB-like acyl-CoA transferase
MADPQVVHNRTIQTHTDPVHGTWRTPKPPAAFQRTPSEVASMVAQMGEHTRAVLAELGLVRCDAQ